MHLDVALLTWVLRDGISMIGRILFSWHFSSSLDDDCKTWRLAADVFNDMGMALGLVSPLMPTKELTVTMMCLSTINSALCGVTGGATRGSLTQHFARQNNVADVSAKDGSQETIINLVGMLTGTLIISRMDAYSQPTKLFGYEMELRLVYSWIMFVVLMLLHLYTNYLAVRAVVLETLNRQRLEIIVKDLLDQLERKPLSKPRVMSPDEVAERERIFSWHFKRSPVRFAVSLESMVRDPIFSDERFVIELVKGVSHVALERGISVEEQIKAFVEGLVLAHTADREKSQRILHKLNNMVDLLRSSGWTVEHHHLTETSPGTRYERLDKKQH